MDNSIDIETNKIKNVNETASTLSASSEVAEIESYNIDLVHKLDEKILPEKAIESTNITDSTNSISTIENNDSNGKYSVLCENEKDRTICTESLDDAKRNNGVIRGESESDDKVQAIEKSESMKENCNEHSNGAKCVNVNDKSDSNNVIDKSCDLSKCLSNAVTLCSTKGCEEIKTGKESNSNQQIVPSETNINAHKNESKEIMNHKNSNEIVTNIITHPSSCEIIKLNDDVKEHIVDKNVPERADFETDRKIIISPPRKEELNAVHSTCKEKSESNSGINLLYMNVPDFSKRLNETPKNPSVIRDLGALRMNPPDFSKVCHKNEIHSKMSSSMLNSMDNTKIWSNSNKSIEVNHSNFSEISKKYNYVSDLQLKNSYVRPMETTQIQCKETRSHDLYVSRPFERVENSSIAMDNSMKQTQYAYGSRSTVSNESIIAHRNLQNISMTNNQHHPSVPYYPGPEQKIPTRNYEQDTHQTKSMPNTSREMYVTERDRYVSHHAKVNYYSHSYHEYDQQRKPSPLSLPSESHARNHSMNVGMKPLTPSAYYYDGMKPHSKPQMVSNQTKQLPSPMNPSSYASNSETLRSRHHSPSMTVGSPSPQLLAQSSIKLSESLKNDKPLPNTTPISQTAASRNIKNPNEMLPQQNDKHRIDEPKRPASVTPRGNKNERLYTKYSSFGTANTMIDPFIYLQSSETDLNYQIIKKTLNKEIPVPSFNRRYVQDQHSRRLENEQKNNAEYANKFDLNRKPETALAENIPSAVPSPRHVPTIQYSATSVQRPLEVHQGSAIIENRREIYDPTRGTQVNAINAVRPIEEPLGLKVRDTRPANDLSMSSTVTSSKSMSPSSSVFKQPKRESPLDLSVKTVKTKADSSGLYDQGPSNSRREEIVAQSPKINFSPNFMVSSDPAHPGVISNRRRNTEIPAVSSFISCYISSIIKYFIYFFFQQDNMPRVNSLPQEHMRNLHPSYRPQSQPYPIPNHDQSNSNNVSNVRPQQHYPSNRYMNLHSTYDRASSSIQIAQYNSNKLEPITRYEELRQPLPINDQFPTHPMPQINSYKRTTVQAIDPPRVSVPYHYLPPNKPYGSYAFDYNGQTTNTIDISHRPIEQSAFQQQRKRVSDERQIELVQSKQMRFNEPEYKNSHENSYPKYSQQPQQAWPTTQPGSSNMCIEMRRENVSTQINTNNHLRPSVPLPLLHPSDGNLHRQQPMEAIIVRSGLVAETSITSRIPNQNQSISPATDRSPFVTVTSIITPPESRKPIENVAETNSLIPFDERKCDNQIKKADKSVISKLRTSLEQKEIEKQKLKNRGQGIDEGNKNDMASLIAARIRTKGELKGFTPAPVEKVSIDVSSNGMNNKSVNEFDRDKVISLNLNLNDWGSTCNNFLKQLENGTIKKQLPKCSKSIDERKSKSSESDGKSNDKKIIPETVTKKSESETSSSDEEEDNKPLLLLRQESLNEKKFTETTSVSMRKDKNAQVKKKSISEISSDISESDEKERDETKQESTKFTKKTALRKSGNENKVLTLRNKKDSNDKNTDDKSEKKEKLPKKRNPSRSSDDDENDDAEKTIPAHIVKKRKPVAVIEETMTRSKRKREIETEMANSKILRNYKVVKYVTTPANKKEIKMSPNKKPADNARDEIKSSPLTKRKNINSKNISPQSNSETDTSESESENNTRTRSSRISRNINESKCNDSQTSDSSKDVKFEKKLTPRKTPKKGKEKCIDGDDNKNKTQFPPGWEKQFYEFKRSLKIPPSLITVGRPNWQGKSPSLPDLDPQNSSDASENFKSGANKNRSISANRKIKCNKKHKCIGVDENNEDVDSKSQSIIDVLHQRVSRASLRKKSKICFNYNEPRILPQINAAELLSTPGREGDVFKPDNVFETSVFNSRTRREYRTLKTKEIIREVFGGEDRPASAPPGKVKIEPTEDISNISQETFDQKYEQYVKQMNIDYGEKIRKFKNVKNTSESPKIDIKIEQIDDNQNDETMDSQDFDFKLSSNLPERHASTPVDNSVNVNVKLRKNRHSRRKGSSGELL